MYIQLIFFYLYEQINLYLNLLIFIIYLNLGVIILKILPRKIFMNFVVKIFKKVVSIIQFFLFSIVFYFYYSYILKQWNYRKEHPEYEKYFKEYTIWQDVRFSYFYIRYLVIRSNLNFIFWSKFCKIWAFFYFLFVDAILNYYSLWVIYWFIKFNRWFIFNMSQIFIIILWRIMLWFRVQIFIYINIDTFFSLMQSFNFIELEEEDDDFILDSPPFIFYYKLRNFFFELFPKRYSRNILTKIKIINYFNIFFCFLKIILTKGAELFFFYYNKILLLLGILIFYIFDNFSFLKLYLLLELNYWAFFLNTDSNSFKEFFKEFFKICYSPFVYLFLNLGVIIKIKFNNRYIKFKNKSKPYLSQICIILKYLIFVINTIFFNSIYFFLCFIYYLIRFTIFFRIFITFIICIFFIDLKMLISLLLHALNFFTENFFYFDANYLFKSRRSLFITKRYGKHEVPVYWKPGRLEKFLDLPLRLRRKKFLATYDVGKYFALRKRAWFSIKLSNYRIRRWWKIKKWFDKAYYFRYGIIKTHIEIAKCRFQRLYLRLFWESRHIFVHSFFWNDFISFYFFTFIELCFYLLVKWYILLLNGSMSFVAIDYKYLLYLFSEICYYGDLILSYIFIFLFEKLNLLVNFIFLLAKFLFSIMHQIFLFLNKWIKFYSFNYLIWYIYIITQDLFNLNYFVYNFIEKMPLIIFRDPIQGELTFWGWFTYFLSILVSFYTLLKWALKIFVISLKSIYLILDYQMSLYTFNNVSFFSLKIKFLMHLKLYIWRFCQKIIDFFSLNYDIYRHRYDQHERVATIRRRRKHPFFRMRFRSKTNSFVSYKRWGFTANLLRLWNFEDLKTSGRWRFRNVERSRIIKSYLFHHEVKKGRKIWGSRHVYFRLNPRKILLTDYLQLIFIRTTLRLNHYTGFLYYFLIIFLCLFTGFRQFFFRKDIENVNAEFYWKRFRLEPLENLNWLFFNIPAFAKNELGKLKIDYAYNLTEIIENQQKHDFDSVNLESYIEILQSKKNFNLVFDLDVITKRYKALLKLEKKKTQHNFMHYYFSSIFENYYSNLLINSFIMSCIVSYGATTNKNLQNALTITDEIEPVDRIRYDWFSQMQLVSQSISNYLFYLDKNFFSFKMPAWAFHKGLLNYKILSLKNEDIEKNEKYNESFYNVYETPGIFENFFFLFLVIPAILLNVYLRSVGYMMAGAGRGVSAEWIHYFLNYYLRSEFILSVYSQVSNVNLNVTGHRRNRSNYTGSWTPFRGRFRYGFFLRKRYLRYTHAWGDIALNFRKKYTYSRLFFYKHLAIFNFNSHIFTVYACYIGVVVIYFFIFVFWKTENYIDNDCPGRNYHDLDFIQEAFLIRLAFYLGVMRAKTRKFLIKNL